MGGLPFWLAGLIRCIRRFQDPAHRTLILATLAAPAGAALVDWGITRGLAFIIPATLMTALGIEMALEWLRSKWSKLCQSLVSLVIFAALAIFSFVMMADALTSGPTWYTNYGLDGMQYGARQVIPRAAKIAKTEPETTVYVSSTWANGSDVLLRYFADGIDNLKMGNINAWALDYRPLDQTMLFVMTEDDLDFITISDKFHRYHNRRNPPLSGWHFGVCFRPAGLCTGHPRDSGGGAPSPVRRWSRPN